MTECLILGEATEQRREYSDPVSGREIDVCLKEDKEIG